MKPANSAKCSCCNGATEPWSSAIILKKYPATYSRCTACGFIAANEPLWLDEAYSDAIAASDTGLLRRNFILSAITQSVIRSYCNPKGKFIDYGGGYGALVRLLRDAGYDFYRHDPMCTNIFARNFDVSQAPPAPDYEMATAFEVFEHLTRPADELEKILAYSRNILFTTLLQPSPSPKPDSWWYYCLDTGQHVALYTAEALASLGRRFGLHYCTDGSNIHTFSEQPKNPLWFKWITRYRVASVRCPFMRGSTMMQTDHESARK